ncbi:MAG TPA: Gfo/Idh/MocA family oxidoreductase, partial [Sphingobacteriaceae bacterium]|nr:Gfo/Idh/MocA family oxidoreductase [Sphingobacteriaceae bacterium]
MKNSRREFILQSTKLASVVGLATAFPTLVSLAENKQDKKIRVGAIGINGMGWGNLNAILKHPDVICTALCDVDQGVLNRRSDELKERGITTKLYANYRDMLADPEIDAVIISTPDHW